MLPRRRSLGIKRVPVAAFFLAVGVLAVFAGYLLGKYVVNALVGSTKLATDLKQGAATAPGAAKKAGDAPTAGEQTPAATRLSLPPTTLYRVQLGAFSSKQNAEQLAQKVKAAGFPAHVLGYSPYRVLAGIFGTREAAAKVAQRLQSSGYEVYVSGIQVGGVTLPLDNAPQAYAVMVEKALGKVLEAIRLGASAWDEYVARGQVSNAKSIDEVAKALAQISKDMAGAEVPAAWKDAHEQLKGVVALAGASASALLDLGNRPSAAGYVDAGSGYMKLVEGYQDCLSVAASTVPR